MHHAHCVYSVESREQLLLWSSAELQIGTRCKKQRLSITSGDSEENIHGLILVLY